MMDFPIFLNKFIIGNKYLRHTSFWYWFRLTNHSNWRMDDNIRYWDFWNSLNQGILDMNYKWAFETFWGKGAKPEIMYVSQEAYDKLQEMIENPPPPSPALIELGEKWMLEHDEALRKLADS